jgi:hypothetical protein
MNPNNSGQVEENNPQKTPLPASNPASGINNIPLGGENIEGVTESELKSLIQKVLACKDQFNVVADDVANISLRVNDKNLRHKLDLLSKALMHSNSGRTRTKDPLTGELDPSYQDIAREINELFITSGRASKVYNNSRLAQTVQKKKKKTRGNPFRVLMGKVGKLLDHGVEKNDIVRNIAKLKYWNKETIERAVDIVKEYNRKLKRDDDKEDKDDKDDKKKAAKTASLNYDESPKFEKRSTGELITRACFLLDLLDYSKSTPQGDFKDPADKKGAKEELTQIRKALKDRGFNNDELLMLGLGN